MNEIRGTDSAAARPARLTLDGLSGGAPQHSAAGMTRMTRPAVVKNTGSGRLPLRAESVPASGLAPSRRGPSSFEDIMTSTPRPIPIRTVSRAAVEALVARLVAEGKAVVASPSAVAP